MAGVHIELDDAAAIAALSRVAGVAESDVLFADIGELLQISHVRRFEQQKAPDGSSWAPLSPWYRKTKPRNKDKVLVLDGLLAGTLRYQATLDELLFGTDRVYGAVHQFGAKQGAFGTSKNGRPIPWGDIPARPFLGLSQEDSQDITDLVIDRLSDALQG